MSDRLWKFLTSLKLTVVLLALSTLLVFLGTVAQVHEGLWEAQERWFKSFLVFRRAGDVWWVPPVFPGGYTLGFALLINLIAAHIKRFQFSWKKVGIHLTHAGIILLLVGQLVTDLFSRESFMSFAEGETRSYSEAHRAVELVITTPSNDPARDKVVSLNQDALATGREWKSPEVPFELRIREYGENGEVFSHSALREAAARLLTALATLESKYGSADGLVAEVKKAQENEGRVAVWKDALKAVGEDSKNLEEAVARVSADPVREKALRGDLKQRFRTQMLAAWQRMPRMQQANEQARAMAYVAQETAAGRPVSPEGLPTSASQGAGQRVTLLPVPAVRGMDERNSPYAKVELFENGKSLGTWLLSTWLNLQEFTVAGRSFKMGLRNERSYHPFSLTLLKTTNEVYTGTDIPKNFQSRVLVENAAKSERREVDISMNNPLRYGGLTFFQHQMGRTEMTGGKGTSVLQVVRNPGWLTPYAGCAIVSLGMLWQFLYHLVGFLGKRSGSPAKPNPATSA